MGGDLHTLDGVLYIVCTMYTQCVGVVYIVWLEVDIMLVALYTISTPGIHIGFGLCTL